MPRFRTHYDTELSQGEVGIGLSLAVPNRELTIREMLKYVQTGQPLPSCGLDVYFDERPDFDKMTLLDKQYLDLTEISDLRRALFLEQEAIIRGVDAYKAMTKSKEELMKSQQISEKFERYLERENAKDLLKQQ